MAMKKRISLSPLEVLESQVSPGALARRFSPHSVRRADLPVRALGPIVRSAECGRSTSYVLAEVSPTRKRGKASL